MAWSRWFLLVALSSGCASSSPNLAALRAENARLRQELAKQRQPKPQPATERVFATPDWTSYPVGDLWIPWQRTASLGWADFRVRTVRKCNDGIVGIQLEVKNVSAKRLSPYDLERAATLVVAGARQAKVLSFDERCQTPPGVELAPGTADKIWLTFKGDPERAELLELSLDHPEGMAHHDLVFGLREGVRAPKLHGKGRAKTEHPPAEPKRIGEPVETPYYRVTVVGKRLCLPTVSDDGKLSLGIEVLFENFSNVDFEVGESGKLEDTKGYAFDNSSVAYLGSCEPRLSRVKVEPGGRARGWLFPFLVPSDVGALTLSYWISRTSFMSGSSSVSLPIGALPKPEAGDAPVAAPSHWTKPSPTAVNGARYTVTVTNVKPCSPRVENGKMWLGVELRIDNRGATKLSVPGTFSAKDDQGYSYPLERYDFGGQSPCQPMLGYDVVKPGDKVRGWLGGFHVPVTTGKLTLETSFSWERPRGSRAPLDEEDVTLPIGQLDAAGAH